MTTTEAGTPIPVENESADDDLDYAIRDCVRTYARWRGRQKAMETFGVPGTPSGASWSEATWAAPCPKPSGQRGRER